MSKLELQIVPEAKTAADTNTPKVDSAVDTTKVDSTTKEIRLDLRILPLGIEGAAGSPLQESGWSGRHPHGRETRRFRVGRLAEWTVRTGRIPFRRRARLRLRAAAG